jgi:hypothetical protein
VTARLRGAKRREVVRQVRVRELKEVLGPIQVGQSVLPEVAQARAGRELVACQLMDGPGDQHLAAVRESADVSAAVDGDVRAIGLLEVRLSRMERDTDTHAQVTRPVLLFRGALELERARHGIRRTGEQRHAGVSFPVLLQRRPAAHRHDRGYQVPVPPKRLGRGQPILAE